MAHRAGFVNIIGNPNVGKSTLMNALVGEKLSIVTAKAQTTRHRIMGIVSGEDYQIVYSDTPGILKPNYRLQENMLSFVDTAIGDADIILYVTDTVEKGDKNEAYIEKLRKVECPVVLVITGRSRSVQIVFLNISRDDTPEIGEHTVTRKQSSVVLIMEIPGGLYVKIFPPDIKDNLRRIVFLQPGHHP